MNYTEWADNIFDKGRLVGEPTGYKELDRMVGGIRRNTVTVLVGATGMGKSMFAINVMVNMARNGTKVAYLDLENGAEVAGERFLRIWYKLPKEWFDDSKHKEQASQMLQEIFDGNISYWSPLALKAVDFFNQDRKMLTDILTTLCIGNKVVFIDPLQMLTIKTSQAELMQEQGAILEMLNEITKKHKSAVVLCHHLRKSTTTGGVWVEDTDDVQAPKVRVPTIDDVKGSSMIADHATDVWGFVKTTTGKSLLRVLKNRNGFEGDIRLQFNNSTLVYEDGLSHEENVGLFLKGNEHGL